MQRSSRGTESTNSIRKSEEDTETVETHDRNADKETYLCCLKMEPFETQEIGKPEK